MKKLGLHRYAVAVSLWVLIVVAAGSVVTTEGAARAIPDWPLAFGSIFPAEAWNPLVLLALVHRYIAAVGCLAVVALAIAAFQASRSSAVRVMATAALLLMMAQAVLGGVDVLNSGADWIGLGHALLAQLILVPVAAIAYLTWPETANPAQVQDYGWPSLRVLALWTPAVLFGQIAFGALYRHHILSLVPHIAGAMLAGGAVLLFALFTFTQFPHHPSLRALSTAVLVALLCQVVLGITTYALGAAGDEQSIPGLGTAIVVAGHVAIAGVLLVFCSLLAARVRRCVLPKVAHAAGVQAVS